MDNIRLFDTELSFTRQKNSFDYPTVAYIRENDRIYYEPHPKNVVGSVYMKGPYGNTFVKINNIEKYKPELGWSPIGVVVIPAFHMEDEKCRIISLKEMNYSTPDTGSILYQGIYWGGYGTDISSLTNYNVVCHVGNDGTVNSSVQGTTDYAYLPSDKFNTVLNPYDKGTYYWSSDEGTHYYIPSPFLNDGKFNVAYSSTTSPSSTNNAMSDFDGVGNTKIITDLATSQADWKTASTITNESGAGYYPAACCCWRYHTDGTSQGDWYLPACGELGYIIPKFNQIQASINALRSAYGNSVGVQLYSDGLYWSSSECSSSYARYVSTYNGGVNYGGKGNDNYVRAFLKV